MTAGTGVRHSEFNASQTEPVHFLQIWILPEASGLPPGCEQKTFAEEDKRGRLRLVASQDGRDGSITVRQDVGLYAAVLGGARKSPMPPASGRHAWLQVARGDVALNGKRLGQGDGAAVSGERELTIAAENAAEILLFDLA